MCLYVSFFVLPYMHLFTVHMNYSSSYSIGQYVIKLAHSYHLVGLYPNGARGQGHICCFTGILVKENIFSDDSCL